VAKENKGNRDLGVRTSPVQRHADGTLVSHEEIRRRAYEIYVERGGLPGSELGDWLRAERELRKVALFTRDWNRLQQWRSRAPNAEETPSVTKATEREN
jgi:hypothetical protein